MTKINEIIQAWKNYVKPTGEVSEIAAERMEVCSKCPAKDFNVITGFYCSICACPLAGKTHSPINSCDLNKWIR